MRLPAACPWGKPSRQVRKRRKELSAETQFRDATSPKKQAPWGPQVLPRSFFFGEMTPWRGDAGGLGAPGRFDCHRRPSIATDCRRIEPAGFPEERTSACFSLWESARFQPGHPVFRFAGQPKTSDASVAARSPAPALGFPPGITSGIHAPRWRIPQKREFWALRGRGGTGTIHTVLFGGETRKSGATFQLICIRKSFVPKKSRQFQHERRVARNAVWRASP